jgi:hypothetical protein
MHVRVVRFTDVSADRLTAVVLQEFATADDLDAAAKVFSSMDASETPGTRASVDACEQTLEMTAP